MAHGPSNEALLQQLRSGIASFEIAPSPVPSVSGGCRRSPQPFASLANASPRFFARIGRSLDAGSPAMEKVERYSVRKITGDGRCLFRALRLCTTNGNLYNLRTDELRMAVKEVICDNEKERRQYEEALVAITVDESLKRYCQRIGRPDFWGGEAELLVLSKLCCQSIVVYIPEHEHSGRGAGFIPIQEYGSEFRKGLGKGKPQKAVRLLYTGRNHYDLLV